MNINFSIGLGFLEFCCHFVAMVCYIGCGFSMQPKIDTSGWIVSALLLLGMFFTTIGAHL
jgi:hypothetical protein